MIKNWLSILEIRTKITSLFAFVFALSYLFLNKIPIIWDRTLLFFVSMLAIDLMATGINNISGARLEKETLAIPDKNAVVIVLFLALIGVVTGLYLVKISGLLVLVVGAICFLFATLYSAGPIPISHTPFGEIVSGLFYGLAIPFLLLYINYPPGSFVTTVLEEKFLIIHFNIPMMMDLFVLSLIPVLLTANIMLANNICDMEKDRDFGRHTLPYFLGKERALLVWKCLHYGVYVASVIAVTFGTIPWPYALLLLNLYWARREMAIFVDSPIKSRTFPVSIRLYIGQMTTVIVLIFASGFLERLLK